MKEESPVALIFYIHITNDLFDKFYINTDEVHKFLILGNTGAPE